MSKNTFVIGDIHGAVKALIQILKKSKISTKDKLIFLGDYVDGWSQSPEVINHLIQLKSTHNCIFLRGNHDNLCYRWLKYQESPNDWLYNGGGLASINAYKTVPINIRNIHIHFFEGLENYHLDSENRLFVHGGFTHLKGVEKERCKEMFYWDRSLWETALATNKGLLKDGKYYPRRLLNYKEIFIGHTALSEIGKSTPVNAENVWNLDTGAAHKNPLTILNVDTKEFWQSDPVYKLYPNEKGRN